MSSLFGEDILAKPRIGNDFGYFRSARKTDPQTSHDAAQQMVESGTKEKHARIVLGLIQRFPYRTAAELAQFGKLDQIQICRRIKELELAGLIRNTGARECRVKGTNQRTWSTN